MFRLTTSGSMVGAAALATTLAWPTAGAEPSEQDLAMLFPALLEDQPFVVETYSGPEWMASLDTADATDVELMGRTQDLITFYAGKTLDDLTIATTVHESRSGETATITAIRVRDTFATDYRPDLLLFGERLVPFSYSDEESYLDVVAGRIVDRPVDEFDPEAEPVAIYQPLGDTSWLIDAPEPVLSEIMAALPAPGGRLAVPQLGIAVTWPDEWPVETVARRIDRNGLFGELLGPDDTVWEIAYANPYVPVPSMPPGGCSVRLYETSKVTMEGLIEYFETTFESPWDFVDFELTGIVRRDDLPGGEAAGLTFIMGSDEPSTVVLYAVDRGDGIAVVGCNGELPEERWLSMAEGIAETIELLPREGDVEELERDPQ